MIILHHEKETDFSNNGYGSLDNHIISPEVFWEMNGEFKLSFEYPMFGADEHITQNLVNRQIILSPVPYMDDQAFRIYRTQENLGYIYIEARHIFYDLLDNLIEDTNVVDKDGLGALSQLLGATQYPHNFKAFSNITKRTNMRTVRYNPVSAIMNDAENNTFINRWGGEILRDNFNIHMRTRLGSDKGVQIEHKKDLLGYEAVIDESTMATRIMPIGFDGLRLPEKYIDSPLLDPDSPKIRIVRYEDVIAAVGEYADREEAIPLEQAYAELRRLAQEEFTVHHVDEPETVIKVDFVTLENTKEYEEFKELQEIHQGDTVRVIVPEQDFEVTSRLVAFTSNPLLKNHYLTTTLGNHVLEYTTSRTEINILRREIKSTNELVNVAIQAANGKNSNYWGTVDPNDIELNPQLEDTYFQEDGDYFAIWEFVEENGERYWRKGPNSDFGKELSNQIADVISDVESTREIAEDAINEIDGALQGSGKITLADLIASKITEDDFETLFFQQSDSVGFTYNENGVRKAIIAIIDGTPYIKGEHVILDGDTVVNGDFKVSGDMLANGAVIQQLEADGIDAQDVNIINLNASNISGGNLELAKGLKITHNGKVIFGVNADNILNMDEDIKEELKGEDGKDGEQGPQGPQGPQGSEGPQGVEGPQGPQGKATYTWIRYADTSTGGGISNSPTGKEYIGLAHNQDTATESDTPSDYTWSLIRGEQGNQGVEGPKGKDGETTYTWIKYSANADGSGLTDTPQANTAYIGIATNKTTPDELDTPSEYTWSLFKGPKGDTGEQGPRGLQGQQGPEGKQGIQGLVGKDGTSTYTHIAYATSKTGANFEHSTFDTATYIGMYVSDEIDSSDTPSDYEWTLIKGKDGSQGLQGPKGDDGLTPYFHTAWANSADGVSGFDTTVSTNKLYIGTATTFEPDDPTEPSEYSWTKIKGDKGDKGDEGPQGPEGPKGATGSQGPRGNTGTSVESVTEYYLATSESSGIKSTDTRFTTAMQSMTADNKYLWNYEEINFSDNTSQPTIPVIIGVYGDKGETGNTGATGRSIVSITEHYLATSANSGVTRSTSGWKTTMQPTTETNRYLWNYETINWSSGTTPTYVDPIIIGVHGAKGSQGPQGIKGDTGDDGQSQWAHIRYSANADGSGMDTNPSSTTKYIGIVITDSESVPPYGEFTWSKYVGDDGSRGPQGIKGDNGDDGKPTYTWVKYADTPTSGMNDFPEGKKYIGLAFNQTDENESTSYGAYQWSLMPQNIEIGGRNYVLNSDFSNEWNNWHNSSSSVGTFVEYDTYPGKNFLRIDNSDGAATNPFVQSYTRVGNLGKYTLSWVQKGTGRVIFQNATEGNSNLSPRVQGEFTGEFSRHFLTLDIEEGNPKARIVFQALNGHDISVSDVKLEKGNTATDWTEAPEDTQAKIDDKTDLSEAEAIRDQFAGYVPVEGYEAEIGEINSAMNTYLAMLAETDAAVNGAYDEDGNLIVDDEGNPVQEGALRAVEDLLERTAGISSDLDEFTQRWNFIDTSIIMGEEGLFIGDAIENIGIRIAPPKLDAAGEVIEPARIDFIDSDEEPVAFISGQLMQINRGIFVQSATIGEHKIETIGNGHTIWQWTGDE